jgi:hypothetical protein
MILPIAESSLRRSAQLPGSSPISEWFVQVVTVADGVWENI